MRHMIYPPIFPFSSATMKASGEPFDEDPQKEVGVILWKTNTVDLHYAL